MHVGLGGGAATAATARSAAAACPFCPFDTRCSSALTSAAICCNSSRTSARRLERSEGRESAPGFATAGPFADARPTGVNGRS